MKRPCSGYRDQSSLVFRDETTRTQEKSQRQSRTHGLDPRSASNAAIALTYSLPVEREDIVTCHFYHTTLETLSERDPSHHLHAQLPGLYAKSHSGSALRLATEAISYATSTNLVPEGAQLSRKRYVQATRAVRFALQNAQEAGDDQTLYAILLLCGYEVRLYPLLDGAAIHVLEYALADRRSRP